MPLPGPPAENDPPPPISMLSTQNAMKSSSLWEQLSSPTTMCANSGIGVGPRLTFDKSFVTYITQIHNQLHRLVTITISSEYTRFWCCPHSMQWSVYVMIRCPSARPSVLSIDVLLATARGKRGDMDWQLSGPHTSYRATSAGVQAVGYVTLRAKVRSKDFFSVLFHLYFLFVVQCCRLCSLSVKLLNTH